MRRVANGLVIAVAAFGLLVPVASAEVRVDFEGGAIVPTSDVSLNDGTTLDLGAGGSWAIGAGYLFGDHFELGGQFQQGFSGFDIGVAENSLNVISLTGGGRFYPLPKGRVRPWLVTQIGWYRARGEIGIIGIGTSDTEDTFGLNTGGGLDVHITDLVSLGVDVRYHNAFNALGGLQFVTTMFNVALHFGN